MERKMKCEILKSRGYTYDRDTGKIYGIYGKEITRKNDKGYILIHTTVIEGQLRGHHFAWYMTYGNVDFIELDHMNRITSDNRIDNLRIVTHQQNKFNSNAKGYTWNKGSNKWRSQIKLNGKTIHLGYFNTEEEAHQSYLKAKKIYHHF